MSAYEGHAVRWACAKCGQEHVLKETDNPEESVVPVGQKGRPVQSNTQEIFTITSRSTRRESDAHGSATVRSGGWHVTVLGQRQGPMNDYGLMELLAAGKINSRTYIWRSPMATWVRMKDLKEVEGLLAQTAAGAAARHDSGSWPLRQTSPGIDIQGEPPHEPSPWDSRVTTLEDGDVPTGRHGIKATPTSQSAGSRADELYQNIENPALDPRRADAVLPDDEGAGRTTPGGYWHSPDTSRDESQVRESRDPFGSEITQPGKKTYRRRPKDRRKAITIGVVIGAVLIAAIVLTIAVWPESPATGKNNVKKPVAAATTQHSRVAMPPATPVQPPVQPPVTPVPVPDPVPAPVPVPVPAPDQPEKEQKVSDEVIVPVPGSYFDEKALMTFVQEQVPGFSTCRKMMAKQVETAINVNMMFTVAASGDIETLVITPINVNDPALNVCMQTIIRRWDFPPVSRPIGFKGTVVIP